MVPVVALDRRGARIAEQFAEVARRVSCSGVVLLGPETAAFESAFSVWTGGAHTVAVSSGASALQLALAAVGVGPGDEVIVPAFTAVPTAAAVCALGATPVFVDVERDTANLDPTLVAAARTSKTRAVIVVHLYGRPAQLPETDLPIIEDAAQAHGAVNHDSRSVAVAYSFYPTKNLGGIGDGGAVVTNDPELADQVRTRRVHGMRSLYVHETVSQNFRMSELEAAWLQLCLPHLTRDNERRRAIAARYRRAAAHLRWQEPDPLHVYHLCVFRSDQPRPRPRPTGNAWRCDIGAVSVVARHAAGVRPFCGSPPVSQRQRLGERVHQRSLRARTNRRRSRTRCHCIGAGYSMTVNSVSAMFPCYNDAETITGLVDDVYAALSPLVAQVEVIVVNDGSSDGSKAVLEQIGVTRPWLRVIHHERNRGYGGALISGFAAAQHEWIFYTDGDAQYDAGEAAY